MTDHTRQFAEHHPETYARKYRCPWCEQDFTGDNENDCPKGCGQKCRCGRQATTYIHLLGGWSCDECCNEYGERINSFGGGD